MKTLIIQPYGLGDHIICNGLIRKICKDKSNEEFALAVKEIHFESVKFMFRDINNLELAMVTNCIYNPQPLTKNCYEYFKQSPKINIAHDPFLSRFPGIGFDEIYYRTFGLTIQDKWNSFHIERDKEREKDLFNKFNINSDYVFVHDDERFKINKELWGNTKVIKPDPKLTNNIFDYLSIIENAKELHLIESSFLFLTDMFDIKGKLFNHRYARSHEKHMDATFKLNWEILK